MKPKYQRLTFIVASIISIAFGLYLILSQFNQNIVFFYTPSELPKESVRNKVVRIGGLVKNGSILKNIHNTTKHQFILTDNEKEIVVEYEGMLPNLFRENQGIVAKGKWSEKESKFIATELLAKHDEKYMPKEIADKLKEKGYYQAGNKR